MTKVFIDGSAGTTGLRIYDRLSRRDDIEQIVLPEEQRKDPASRKRAFDRADVVFLCLPDAAAREAVAMIDNPDTVVLDTSTAHRTAQGWTYGFPELSAARAQAVRRSKRIAVPGCHASGFIALVYPLIEARILPPSAALTCFSLTGYSGGGKKMIAQYEEPDNEAALRAPRQYALAQQHKHLREMQAVTGLAAVPAFCPVVAAFYSGMQVTVPVFASQLMPGNTVDDIRAAYAAKYTGPVVTYMDKLDDDGFLSAGRFSGKDGMGIAVCGNEERMLLTATYDNLGKGASGAALECLNLVMGQKPARGLTL